MRRRRYGAKSRGKEPFYLKATKKYGKKSPSLIILVLILAGIGWELNRFVQTSPVFNVSHVEIRTNGRLDKDVVSKLVDGSNIFEIDIAGLTQLLEKRLEVKRARIIRILPDRLIVNLEERLPVAQVRANRYFPVDKEGIILPWVSEYPDPDIPVIIGVGLKVRRIKPGEPYHSNRLEKALELLGVISRSRSLKDGKVTKIDVRDLGDISFLTDEIVEVKIGGEDFERKIQLMDKVLLDARSRERGLDYIDLRFGDVIVGWR